MNMSLRLRYLTLLLVSLCLTPAYPLRAAVIYVDANATGANNGSSWIDAYKYLQDALWAAEPNQGIQIWVAQGTYKPDRDTNHPSGTNDQTATFQLTNGVAIYGGFPAGGGFWENRDPNTYETILSGDINVPGDNSDNSYHVVTGSGTNSTAILDGFTITAGYANTTSSNYYGAGMYNSSGSPTITNCIFSGNFAPDGGGMYNDSSNPTITNCTFSSNSADYHGGGGMYNSSSSPTIINCTFTSNYCPFMNAPYGGGGMRNDSSSPILSNCIFSGNISLNGGGILNSSSSPTITNCTFSGNSVSGTSGGFGGGILNSYGSSPTITNCTLSGNSASWIGGGMYNDSSSPTITNCTFSSNSAIYGGGMFNASSSPTVINCILWGNTAKNRSQIYNASSTPTVSFSDVQGGWVGEGNIDADPLFVDAKDDNLRLSFGSPCIDAGDNNAVPVGVVTDLDGHPRKIDGDCNGSVIVDMGAFEFNSAYLGDFDCDCDVDFKDFAILANQWMLKKLSFDIAPGTGDGIVNFIDWAVFANKWSGNMVQLSEFAAQWLQRGAYNADIALAPHGDGIVDYSDLAVLCDNWLKGVGQ
jgi:hypothetical protein